MKNIFKLLLLIAVFTSCKKEVDFLYEADLLVKIDAYDYKYNMISDKSGILVTANSAKTTYSAITDKDGYARLKNLPRDVYNLSVEKDGFYSIKDYSYYHAGGVATNTRFYINEKLKGSFTDSKLEYRGDSLIYSYTLDFDKSQFDCQRGASIYVDTVPNISLNSSGVDYSYISKKGNTHEYNISINYPSGTTVYFKAYAGSTKEIINPVSEQKEFYGIDTTFSSNIHSITIK